MNTTELIINSEDAKILADVLESNISELSAEISDTDRLDFRENLKSKRMVLQRILAEIKKQENIG
ncbi:MAG: hypothetical protein JSW63_12530 [Ignavibacterium sp.]|nr:MAG: hypothetical protein JSW63_12530 [Ignavibacterium sp.]